MKKTFSAGSKYLLVLTAIMALLFLAACSSTSSTATTSTPAPATTTPTATIPAATTPAPVTTTAGQSIVINLVAQGMAFDQKTITVSAGSSVTMNFDNKDTAPHNFALYTDSSAAKSIFIGEIVSKKSITYTFTAPATPGNYFFRCDVHPTSMTGTFVVQ